jgi:hypothetical protein
MQMGIAPNVNFISYPSVQRYGDFDDAWADCQSLIGAGLDEAQARAMLHEILTQEGDELVFNGGLTLSGIAHWKPQIS